MPARIHVFDDKAPQTSAHRAGARYAGLLGRPPEGPGPSRGDRREARPDPRRGGPGSDAAGPRDSGAQLMGRLKVTQVKSGIGGKENQRQTLRSLGLKRLHDTVVKEDRPEIRGMVNTVTHLVTVEEVE